MAIRSPQRSRRIRNSGIVGAAVGFSLGIVTYLANGHFYGLVFFTIVGAAIAAGTAALASDTSLD